MDEKLYSCYFQDGGEHRHVVLIKGITPEQALERLLAYADGRHTFRYTPQIDDVEEVVFPEHDPDYPEDDHVRVLWHQDYD